MNNIYKVIWSKVTQSFVVTSELGKAQGKSASQVEQSAVESNSFSHFFFSLKVSVVAIAMALLPTSTLATVAIDSNYDGYAVNTGTARPGDGSTDRALNYYNPGNLSYNNSNAERVGSELYSPDQGATGIAIGIRSDARTGSQAAGSGIAIGDYSRSVGGLGISMGHFSQATNIGSTAIGTGALASGFNSLSIMRQSAATDDYAMAIGNVSYAKGKGSLAMGQSSTALGNQSIAIGSADVSPTSGGSASVQMTRYDGTTNTQASADFAVAIGAQSKALKESAVALGTKAKANGLNSTAIGTESSTSEKSAALGYQAKADGEESTAIGVSSAASGNKSLALGMNAKSSTTGAFAIGADSNVSGANAGAIGLNTSVAQQNTIAIGNNITSTQANSLVLGTGSTDREATTENGITLNGTTYTYAGQSSPENGVVSVATAGKERQIINVGAGKVSGDSTDAINGSQLYAVTQELTHFYSVNNNSTSAGNYNNDGATGTNALAAGVNASATGINALAAGVGSSATQHNAVAVGANAKGLGELSVAVGSALAQSSHAVAIGSAASTGSSADSAIAMGHLAKADKDYTVAIGSSANALQDSSVAIGSSAGARGNQTLALGANASAESATATSVGANTFANGTSATAISANAFANGTGATAISTNAKANTIGDVALGANATATGRSTATSISAGSGRNETLGSATAVGTLATATGRNAIAVGNNAQALGSINSTAINDVIAIGANSSVSANRGTALGYKATVSSNASNSIAIGTQATNYSIGAIAIGNNATAGSTTGNNASGVSIGNSAGSGYRAGSENVAIGNQSGQFVNGNTNYALGSRAGQIVNGADNYAQGIEAGQMVTGSQNSAVGYATGRYVNGNNNQSFGVGVRGGTGNSFGQNVNGNDNISLGTRSGRNIGVMTASVASNQVTFNSTTKSNRNIALGYESNNFSITNPLTTGDNLAMGTRTTASGGSAVALGAGAQATGANSIALGTANTTNTADNGLSTIVDNTHAKGDNAIAIGHITQAEGSDSIAQGTNATTYGDNAIAIGNGAKALAENTISIGTGNMVAGADSGAIGDPSYITGAGTYTIGNNNGTTTAPIAADNAGAFGNNNLMTTDADDSRIVGNSNNIQSANVMVMGNNVTVGTGLDGAVVLGNDSAVIAAIPTDKATVGDITYGVFAGNSPTAGDVVSVGSVGSARQIQNVAAGQISATSTDAINGSQLFATQTVIGNVASSTADVLGGNAAVDADGNITMSDIGGTGKDTVHEAIAATKTEVTAGTNVASVTSEAGANGQTVYTVNANGSTVSKGSDAVTVTAGTKDTTTNITDYKVDLSQTTKDSLTKADSALQTVVTQIDGTTVTTLTKDANTANFITGSNIELTAENGGIKIATKDEVNFTSLTAGPVTINTDGIDAGDKQITNVAAGTAETDAVNVKQLTDAVGAVNTYDGWNLSTNGGTAETIAENTTVDLSNTDGNITLTQTGSNVVFGLANNISVGTANPVNIDGDAGTIDGLTNKTFDPENIVSGQAATEDQLVVVAEDVADNATNIATNTTNIATNAADIAKGIKVGDGDTASQYALGDTINITEADSNIVTTTTSDGVSVGLAKDITVTSMTTGNTVINNDGVTIKDGPSLTTTGLDNAGNVISNVGQGVAGTDAVNKDQLDALRNDIAASEKSAVVTAGKNTTVDKDVDGNVTTYTVNAEKTTVSEGNGVKVVAGDKDENGVTDYQVSLDKDITVGSDQEAGSITVKGEKGQDGTTPDAIVLNGKDGTIGLNGKDGANAIVSVKKGAAGLDGKDGKPRLTVGDEEVATLNDGLNFVGDNADVTVARKLNQTLAINGGAEGETSAKNIKTIGNADGSISIQLAKDLAELTSVATENFKVGDTVTINKDGINAGGTTISNIGEGKNGTDAVNKDQLDKATAAAKTEVKAGTNVTEVAIAEGDNGQMVYTVNANGTTVSTASALTVKAGEKNAENVTDYQIDLSDESKASLEKADKALQSWAAQVNGEQAKLVNQDSATVNFVDGDNIKVTNENGDIKISTSKDAKFDTVTINNGGIVEEGSKTAVNGGDVYDAIQNTTAQFAGDNAAVTITRKPSEVLSVTGGATGDTTANNIKTIGNADGSISIQLAKNLVELTSVVTESIKVGDTVEITKDGIDAGNTTISNVKDGVDGKDAVNKNQLDALRNDIAASEKSAVVTAGKNTTVDKDVDGNVTTYTVNAEKTTVSEGNGVKVVAGDKDENGVTDYQVSLDKDITVGSVQEAGSITVKGEKGQDGTTPDAIVLNGKDGTIGLNGKDGANAIVSVKKGAAGLDGKDAKPRLTVGDEEVATLNDGLNFVGDNVDVTVARKLNQKLAINGGAEGETSAKNIKTIGNADGSISIQLAKDLAELTSVATENFKVGDTVTINKDGINAGGTTISNIGEGKNGTDAVNKDQLDKATAAAKTEVKAGTNVTEVAIAEGDNGQMVYTVNANGTTVSTASALTVKAGEKNAENVTDYQIDLSDESKASLEKADKALQSWTAQVNGEQAKLVNQDSTTVNFVDGDNIKVTNENGDIKISTNKDAKFDTVTINNGGTVEEGSKTAVNGGDVYDAIQNTTAQFAGDNAAVTITRKPSEVLSITGGATGDTTANNIKTIGNADGSISIQLAKNLVELTSVATENIKVGDTVEITKDGIDAGNTTISNVKDGVDGKDAVNKNQLDALRNDIAASEKSAVVTAGKNTTVDKDVDGNVTTYTVNAEKTTVSEGNGVKVVAGDKDENGVTDYQVSLDKDITVGSDQEAGSITVKGEKGEDGTTLDAIVLNGKDGTIGLNGKDGANATVSVKNGAAGLDGKDGKARLTVGDEEVATLNDGLKFKGDTGDVIAKTLNETLTIKGNVAADAAVTDKNLRVDNVDGELVLKMAKNLTDLTSATFGDTVINTNGVTIGQGDKAVSLTKGGLDNGGNVISNVGEAVNDTDAVNLGQLQQIVGEREAAIIEGNNVTIASVAGNRTTGSEYIINAERSTVEEGSDLLSVSSVRNAATNTTNYTIDLSDKAKQSIAEAKTEVKAADGENNLTVRPTGENGQAVYEVALSKDLVVDSVKAGNTTLNTDGVTITNGDEPAKTVSLTKDGLNNGGNTITNVGEGKVAKDSKDAVNGGQLFNQGEGVKNIIGGETTYDPNTGTYTNNNIGGTGKSTINDAIQAANDQAQKAAETAGKGWNLSANGANEGNIAPGTTVDLNNTDGNIAISKKDNNVTFNLSDKVSVKESIQVGDATTADAPTTTITNTGVTAGNVSLTNAGINAGNQKVSAVQAGDITATSTDAVNGSQLYKNNEDVANALGGNAAVDSTTGNLIAPSYTTTKTDGTTAVANNVGDALSNLNDEVVKPITFAADSGTHNAKLGTTVNVKGDKNIKTAVNGNTLNISMVDSPEFSSITTGNTVMNNDGVTVNGGTNGAVSLTANGLDNGGNRITNVAPGVEGTDAVNKNQLDAVASGVNQVNNRVNQVDRRASSGTASAMAAAGLPQAYLPGRSMVAVAGGTHRGENALALGVSRISDNGKVVLKLSGATNSSGDKSASVGIGYQW